jgi:hypothetical protein
MQSVGKERNEYRSSLLWLVQYGTGGKCPSSCSKDSFLTFSNCWFVLTSIFSGTLQSIPRRAKMRNRPGTIDVWITNIVRKCWFVVCQIASKCCYQYGYKEKTLQTDTSQNWC